MKRTYTANLAGQVFHIDEDAYNLLQNYLGQLRTTFSTADGDEIMADIEGRIREHFAESINECHGVITLADVNTVIKTMGRPEDISGEEAPCPPPPPVPEAPVAATGKRLYRNMQDKVLGGVIGGFAAYLGWNPTIMRVLLVVLALCTKVFPLVIAYLIAWMVIPAAVTPLQKLRMYGEPVTLGNMGEVMIEEATAGGRSEGVLSTVFSVFAKLLMALFGAIAVVVAFGAICTFVVMLTGAIGWGCFGFAELLEGLPFCLSSAPLLFSFAVMAWALFAGVVSTGLVWGASCVLFNTKGASRITIITGLVMAILLFCAALILTGLCSAAA